MQIAFPETRFTYWTQLAFGLGVAGPYVMLTTADNNSDGDIVGATIDHVSLFRKSTTGRRFSFLRLGTRRRRATA